MIPGRGLILVPGLRDKKANINDKITIVRPDGSSMKTTIKGITFNLNRDILVDSNLTKGDVPIGSEVWLNP
ncbi:hypothetical protein SAMN04488505_105114 [Chitinophaga rupis]|uniref:Uncharacterized protein n=2 Tax=Chitinophaga rupis TaxID=573321 RepID=A0A1H7ZMA5_9BACT|nr:hypothetical protein SAMN04488505_105114 [Chitinophaga rupis]